jgi:hypothetical protein
MLVIIGRKQSRMRLEKGNREEKNECDRIVHLNKEII